MSRNLFPLRAILNQIVLVLGLCLSASAPATNGQVYERLFSFADARSEDQVNSPNRGSRPVAGLVLGGDGNFYGTTFGYDPTGQSANNGTVFRMTSAGVLTNLVEFTGNGPTNKGRYPHGVLAQGSDGNFYGTTLEGGSQNLGTVFRITPAGVLTTLVEFTDNGMTNNGASPRATLIKGSDGNFYGTTSSLPASGGGATPSIGTVFKMTPAGVLTTLVEFTYSNGAYPSGGVVEGSDGNFYGTTSQGGASDYGTVFKMTPAGVLTTLVGFTGSGGSNKGAYPQAGLVQGSDGIFYGTTEYGGASDYGTVFKITSAGLLTTLVEFEVNNGSRPVAGFVQGSDGSFYGTTSSGGAFGLGTVFKMTSAGALTTLGDSDFAGGNAPYGGLVQGSDGSFYGTTSGGETGGHGTVFKITPAGVLTTLVAFAGNGTSIEGRSPEGRMAQDNEGNLYGTTSSGGPNGRGTVFKMTPIGALTTLAGFTGSNGEQPPAGVLRAADGNLYGTTRLGGAGHGTVFKITPDGVLTTLVTFNVSNGEQPYGALVQDGVGNFFGTTFFGGAFGRGTVFKLTPAGELTTLVAFSQVIGSNQGFYPGAGLVLANDGNFYGTTSSGGGPSNHGTVFKMTPAGVLTPLVEFTGNGATNKGSYPPASLVQGSDGNFYGTTVVGGAFNLGTVFRMTPIGVLTTLVEFTGNGLTNKGANPLAGVVQGSDGNFYGTTALGGASGYGTVFQMSPAGVLTTLVEFTLADEGRPRGDLIPATDGNLYGTASGPDGSIYRLIFPGAPLVFAKGALPGSFSALVEARANARGAATAVALEYGNDGQNFPNTVPVASNLTGFQTRLVGTTLVALAPSTLYYYRFRAVSSAGTTVSPVASFSTAALAATATVSAASEVLATSARFHGLVNARSYDATVIFEWGVDGSGFPNQVAAVPAMVTGASEVAVSATVAGLAQGTDYHYRIVATNAGGTTVSAAQSFSTLAEPVAVVGAATAVMAQSARLHGTVDARGTLTSVVFEYGTDGVTFPNSVAATPATVSGDSPVPVSVDLSGLTPDAIYSYRVKGTSLGGIGVSAVGTFSPDLLSQFAQTFPGVPPAALGFVAINLSPAGIAAGWRFAGEQAWRASGLPVGGLTTGVRPVEYRTVRGYLAPPRENVTVLSGGAPVVLSRTYTPTGVVGSGTLTVILKPDDVADVNVTQAVRAQWRFLGEGDPTDPDDNQSATWRNSGEMVTALLPGNYLVECKPVIGRATPAPLNVPVLDGQTATRTATYFLASEPTGTPPGVLPFATVSAGTNLPYGYVGQLRSDVGAGTGFAVRVDLARTGGARVVATAGHVVFDDGALAFATGLQWLFQRDRGTFEPVPLIPRGSYVFDGYAARRTAEATPGISTRQSQHLDAGAIYFLEDAARGGFGGYLASDAPDNPFLLSSALKTLVGYPVDGIVAANQGKMHATPLANVHFARVPGTTTALDPPSPYPNGSPLRLYATTEIRSAGGNSGGPLCVQFDDGAYYPAGIFLGGAGQTVVRSIDSALIALFRRAENSGFDDDPNNPGGGLTQDDTLSSGDPSLASLKVNLTPASAAWKLDADATIHPNGTQLDSLMPGAHTLKFTDVPYFLPPGDRVRTLTAAMLSTITLHYNGITTQPQDRTVTAFTSATFSVGVSGTPTGYQWRRNGANISGATTNPYVRTGVTSSTQGGYSVVVTWPNGAVTSADATLTVTRAAQTIAFPAIADRQVSAGSFMLSATASSGLAVSFQVVSGPATLSGKTLTPTAGGTITVRANQPGSSNYLPASQDRTFQVESVFDEWRGQYFTATEREDPLISGPLADVEADGLNTLLEFALNLHPRVSDRETMLADTGTRGLPLIQREIIASQARVTVEFVRRRATSQPGITYRVEFSGDLAAWLDGGPGTATVIDATWERVKVIDPEINPSVRYGRLVVTMP